MEPVEPVEPVEPADVDAVAYAWRGPLAESELADLTRSSGGVRASGWWPKVRAHSLGWVTAREADGLLVGFVNVAWDGAEHAFLLDTTTHGERQRRGIGTTVVARAVDEARAAGCTWLEVDFEPHLTSFYLDACGFRPTAAGLVDLTAGGLTGGDRTVGDHTVGNRTA